ncbi:C40 family peptidase [Faecalibacter macacae]|uniref:NlpC/P60 family protein n=1 Tax=Faecalibacter macacae TaxID=1859289 RepID=A0A3L9MHQ8_9FLAO|nr:C40 family peptidase [Faecalibacter macacae]RLZ12225.1 NlpC/P60 family protein [Faecalibacter macacae]
MKNIFFYFLAIAFSFIVVSCGSSNKVTSYKKTAANRVYSKINSASKYPAKGKSSSSSSVYRSSSKTYSSKDTSNVLSTAKSFLGVPYKYGGTTRSGFDCSGLVVVSFNKIDYKLPRNSSQQAQEGREIKISDAREGDLVFFNTSGSSISHVGIIESIEKSGEIKFIHSSTSKGVIISSMDENYWKTRFVKAIRLL